MPMTRRFVRSGVTRRARHSIFAILSLTNIPTGVYYQGKRRVVQLAHVIRDKKKLLNRIRRIKGQVDSIERSLEEGAECSHILHTVAACRGAIDGLMGEVIAGHIRFHIVDPDHNPASERAKAAQELIDVIRMYMK